MKLTAILLTVVCIHVSARSFEQTVSFSGKNVPLTEVFSSIEKQTGLSFFFNYKLLNGTKLVTLDVHEVTLDEILNAILKSQGLDYYKLGKTVFIIRRATKFPALFSDEAKLDRVVDVRGRVSNQQGEPLEGATVIVKNGGKNMTAFTDKAGVFLLHDVSSDAVLEVSYTGYQKKEVYVNNQISIEIMLAVANNVLDEVKVIAYGTTTERFSTGDVTTIKAEDIEKQPVKNPLLALEGRVPGLSITEYNGLPGSGVTVRVQGRNSIANGNDPLYVVDGVPYTSQMMSNQANTILGTSGGIANEENGSSNPLSFLNPSDIESISVLKDADATAIYGSRAANGAILITTKRGMVGKTKLNFNLQDGIGQVAHFMSLLKTKQYLELRHEALMNDNATASPTRDYDLLLWDTTRNTNWQKVLIGNSAQYTNFGANMTGGNSLTQYLIGATYLKQTTVFPGDFSDQKGAAHISISSKSTNERLHVRLSMNYLVDNNHLPSADLTRISTQLAPDAPPLYNTDGSLNWALNSSGRSSWNNPLASNYATYASKVNNLISSMLVSYEILKGLEIKANLGYTNLQQNETSVSPLVEFAPQVRPFVLRSATYSNSNINSWILEPQLSYKHAIAKGVLDLLLGTTIERHNSTDQTVIGQGYNSDAVLQNIGAASTITGSSLVYIYKYNAVFGRISYNLLEKYVIDLSARRDGSSRFGPANEFHDFTSVGAGWIFSQEKFVRDRIPWLSFGKLRLSYGTTGNDQIGNYRFLSLYNSVNPSVPYQGVTGLLPNSLSNPYLQWEETRKIQVGLALGFIKDRILVDLDCYRNRSSNQLLNYILPINTGFNSVSRNLPATIQNSGIELTLNTVNIQTKNFKWTTSFNVTTIYNKLLAFTNLATSSYNSSYVIGKPLGLQAVYHFAGVNDTTGKYQFYTSKNTLTYTPAATDRVDTVYLAPKPFGGFVNSFNFKGFELDICLQFVEQTAYNYFAGNAPGANNSNQPTNVLNRWQYFGEQATHQRYNQNNSIFNQWIYAIQSNAAYSDASYIRLKNVSVSWQIPNKEIARMHLQNGRIFAQGQNLATFTKYKGGLDPESQNFALPPLRVITFGVQFGF